MGLLPCSGDEHRLTAKVALFHLGCWLQDHAYRFVTVTPATHARILSRAPAREGYSLQDIFGWNMPFRPQSLPQPALGLLEEAQAITNSGGLLRSKIRFSTLGDTLYLHSAYPTVEEYAVFFGPDTYRFVALIEQILSALEFPEAGCIVDMGCGTGAGGIAAAKLLQQYSPRLILSDINPAATAYAEINAALAGITRADFRQGDLFQYIPERADVIVANPPYLFDPQQRIYRHGGGQLGCALSLRIVNEALNRLAPGGTLILYTGAPVVAGQDILRDALQATLLQPDIPYAYREIDPDVFGEEMENPVYAHVDRIAAVSLVIEAGEKIRTRLSNKNSVLQQPSAGLS
jgi:methylase of polypeptide subunit release factors